MLDQNIAPDAFINATLVDGFIRHGDLDQAKHLFELTIAKGIDPGVVGFNTMIKGYSKFGMMKESLSCVKRMIEGQHSPDGFTYSTLIDGYVKHSDLHSALRMFGQMVKCNCKPNVVTYTSLIYGFCSDGDFNSAEKTFEEMESCGLEPNVVTYTTLIGYFCKGGKLAKACSYFEVMLVNNCSPNDITFNCLLNGLRDNVAVVNASFSEPQEKENSLLLEYYGSMISGGWDKTTAAYISILFCLWQHKMIKTATQLCYMMKEKGFLPDPVAFGSLLHDICLEGRSITRLKYY
uniref:Pentatricopeptide repeat-containing protein n=1 Tax=Rhizophora mucronata TaxID=61149 RepID=A0A2P2IPM8_RHIMU